MRTDMDSLNPGKAMAQAAHAAGQLETHVNIACTSWKRSYELWKGKANGFGTTIVLDGQSVEEIEYILNSIDGDNSILRNLVVDPTYPITDGEVTHLLPVTTCAYLFGPKDNCSVYLSHLPLHV
jgi:hypothetical protein